MPLQDESTSCIIPKPALNHNTAMLKPIQKWGIPSAEEVQSIKETILQLEAKLAKAKHLNHRAAAGANIKKLRRELNLNKAYIAPVRRVPFELLAEIFILCSHNGRSAPVRISAVCRRWRQTILATPLAWNRIRPYIDGPKSPVSLLAYVTTFLQRSYPRLLHLDWTLHPYGCFRSDSSGHKLDSYWEKDCICDIMKRIDQHIDRIQSLQIDSVRMSTFLTKALPNLERVVYTRWTTSGFWLHMQRFPNLCYLDVGKFDFFEHSIGPELPHIMLAQLRHLSIEIDKHGFWCHLIGLHGRSLKTLEITWKETEAPSFQKGWILECSALKCITINDREYVLDYNIRVIRITAPNLEFCQYSSMGHNIRLAHDTDFNKVTLLRTDYETQLSHYPRLRILQLFYKPDLIVHILGQLESDDDLSPELSVIEIRAADCPTGDWTTSHWSPIRDRIAARNQRANSHIKLVVTPHRGQWEHSLPRDNELVRATVLCPGPFTG